MSVGFTLKVHFPGDKMQAHASLCGIISVTVHKCLLLESRKAFDFLSL